jgi:hypothetical protein
VCDFILVWEIAALFCCAVLLRCFAALFCCAVPYMFGLKIVMLGGEVNERVND